MNYDLFAAPPENCKHKLKEIPGDHYFFFLFCGGHHYNAVHVCERCGFYKLSQTGDNAAFWYCRDEDVNDYCPRLFPKQMYTWWSPWRYLKETDLEGWQVLEDQRLVEEKLTMMAEKELDDYLIAEELSSYLAANPRLRGTLEGYSH